MKKRFTMISILVAAMLLLLISGCGQPAQPAGPAGTIEVQFFLNDGTDEQFAVITGTPGDNVFLLGGEPEREGYLFAGWFLDPAGLQAYLSPPESNLSVYAKWVLPCTVTFVSEYGDIPEALVPQGSLLLAPVPPDREGYVFDGWFVDYTLTTLWDFDVDTVYSDMSLYAGWQRVEVTPPPATTPPPVTTYTVSFNSNGGSAIPAISGVRYGTAVSRPANPARSGYSFTGWFSDTGLTRAWDFTNDVVTGNLTLYAGWVHGFAVTFNSNGGSAVSSVYVRQNATIDEPRDPTRSGFAFAGWYADRALTNPWNFHSDRVTRNITLYAAWYSGLTVRFNSNGGSEVRPYNNVRTNSTIRQPENPVRRGYTFAGWYRDRALTNPWNFDSDRVRDNMTLYASWLSGYTVTFNSYGGTTVPPYINVQHNATINPPANPARPGYEFVGWYRGGTPWNFATDRVRENITLSAQWRQAAIVTVSFSANGGINAPAPISGRGGSIVTLPSTVPTREGYIFLGWFVGTTSVGNAGANYTMPMVDTTLTAHWNEIQRPDATLPAVPGVRPAPR